MEEDTRENICLVCGGVVKRKNNKHNKYQCKKCGEIYDLDEFDYSEIDLPTFDKLILHSIKKKPRNWL